MGGIIYCLSVTHILSTRVVCSRLAAATGGVVLSAGLLVGGVVEEEFFEREVRPLLAEHCYRCHSAVEGKAKGGLRLDFRDGIFVGGDSGPAVVAGDVEGSLLMRAVRYGEVDLQMPPNGRLSEEAIGVLERWVKDGAVWGVEVGAEGEEGGMAEFDLEGRKRSHWSWGALEAPVPPRVGAEHPVDAFLGAKLEEAGLRPAVRADSGVLLRRLHLDLVGLPPSPEEVLGFEGGNGEGVWEREVDRLLASPHFGERWARHWMDLVRYADTLGHEFDYATPNAWRYRDYLIRAFNLDLPYDQFVREHIAGDLLEEPRWGCDGGLNESMLATSFYWFGQRVHSPVDAKKNEADIIDNQIDVLTKSFLGLTVACARCHDHKFDAISTRDYHALYGVLASSRYLQRSLESDEAGSELRLALGEELEAIRGLVGESDVDGGEWVLREGDEVLVDFTREGFGGWSLEGEAFGDGPLEAGSVVVLDEGRVGVLALPAAHSAGISRRLQGALVSPSFEIGRRYLHMEVAGRDARVNIVVENHTLIRDPIYGVLKQRLDHDAFRWVTVDLKMWEGRRAYLEFNDLAALDVADTVGGYDLAGYVAVRRVVLSGEAEPPALAGGGGMRVVDVMAGSELAERVAGFREREGRVMNPPRGAAMLDGNGVDERVFIRGNPHNPGEVAPRAFLEALDGGGVVFGGGGSGRLHLAERILDEGNPFVARVYVNRVWQHLFGRGIVATPDDFGVLGREPSHPELLDWLAVWFRTEGQWSTKALIRLLVTSEAYQRTSRPDDREAEERDPGNELWHRMPIRRMDAEVIRDSILAVSGRLDRRLYGPPVATHLTDFMEGRGRPGSSGPLDGDGRRSVYLEVRRNFLSPMLRAFDAPVPFTTIGRRTESNVPAQSLILMNDPFVVGEARRWAERHLAGAERSMEARLEGIYLEAFGRRPTEEEVVQCVDFLESQAGGGEQAWGDLCHVLFNVKEFIYVN
ncbi:MAG: hypothetical protein RI897_2401 [Verrucomicrobiota bacterium]